MGHTERIVAELATLDEVEKARLLAFVHELKAARMPSVQQQDVRAMLSAALAPYRWRLRAFDSTAKTPTPADRLRWQTGCSSTATCCYARSTPPRRPRR